MPYIPQFNKISLQEQAYAPTLMRQQHDEAVAKQMELADALKFDYLKQDASILEPVLNKYSEDIQKVSTDLAKQGFTQDTKSKLLGLRSQYTTDDKIRQVKKNYSDAMSQWDDIRKRMIQAGRPGSDIENQKQSFFSNYQGAFSPDGFKNEFTAGITSGYYDIVEDAKKAMTGIGTTGQIVGSSGSSIKPATLKDANGNVIASGWETTDNKTGQKVFNKDQRLAVEAYLNAEYNDPSTDRGLYAQLNKITPEHIQNAIANVSKSMTEDRYAQLPQQDTNISGMTRAEGSSSSVPLGYLKQSGYGLVASDINDLDKKVYEDVANKLARDEAKATGLTGVSTLADLKKAAGEVKAEKMAVTQIGGPSVINFPTANAVKAKNAIKQIEDKLKNKAEGTALPTYEINTIVMASGKSINEANDLQKGFDDYVSKHINRFTPVGGDKDDLGDLVKNITVTDFSPNFKSNQAGIVLYLHGEDKNGKSKDIPVTLDGTDTKTEETLVSYLNQMNPIIGLEYQYGKEDESGKDEFLSDLEKAIPYMTNPQAIISATSFVESKKLYRK
jgi:hypothetical protein